MPNLLLLYRAADYILFRAGCLADSIPDAVLRMSDTHNFMPTQVVPIRMFNQLEYLAGTGLIASPATGAILLLQRFYKLGDPNPA
jgi:hypothetical protein